jgi:hypothetical protein
MEQVWTEAQIRDAEGGLLHNCRAEQSGHH